MTRLVLPGMIDAHVHLREPGATHKEDALSGTLAALAGGVVGVLDMPNTQPPIVDAPSLRRKQEIMREKAVCDYGLFLGFDGDDVSPLIELGDQVAGLKLYMDETFGDMTTSEPAKLAEVFESWPGPGPIASHAESPSIAVAIRLAERYGQPLHVCHVPHPDDLLHIEAARQRGVAITCEVTPHHLLLGADLEETLGAYASMKPPLLPPALRDLYWERLDLVDAVASDHAPHTRAEKQGSNPPPGVPGLETSLPLMLYAVAKGRLSMERLIELTYTSPLGIYGLAGPEDTLVEYELVEPRALPADGYVTRCGWSPFTGQSVSAELRRVQLRGRVIWEDGLALAPCGYGQPLRRRATPDRGNAT